MAYMFTGQVKTCLLLCRQKNLLIHTLKKEIIERDLMCNHNRNAGCKEVRPLSRDCASPGDDTHSRAVQATGIFQDWISNFVICTHVGDKGFRI